MPELVDMIVNSIVDGIVQAAAALEPARFAIGSGLLYNVSVNRRASISPYFAASKQAEIKSNKINKKGKKQQRTVKRNEDPEFGD